MPRTKKQTGNEPANKQKGTKKCNFCHEEKKMTDFYISKNPIHSVDERVPICKECIAKASLNEDGTINELELNKILKLISRPYYKDLIESSINSFKGEHSYIDDEDVKYYGKEILQKYFTLIAMRQDRDKSYEDSEKDNFIHPTSNTPKSTKERIAKKYDDIKENKNEYQSTQKSDDDTKWTKKDKQNMKYVISVVGYDPFEDFNLSEYDKKYCFNILAGYCDADGITEDGHKIQCVIQLTNLYCQCRKIDESINLELSKNDVDETKISKLTSSKTSILSSIATIAKDNNIASNYNKNSGQGKNTLSAKMKEIVADGFENMKVNLFDIDTSACMKQIADLSNQSIMEQLTFDSNEYTEMIKEQREMLIKLQNENERLEEENRILKNKVEDLENKKR